MILSLDVMLGSLYVIAYVANRVKTWILGKGPDSGEKFSYHFVSGMTSKAMVLEST